MSTSLAPEKFSLLMSDIKVLIIQVRSSVTKQVNSALVVLYWHIGQRINQDIPSLERAKWGNFTIQQLSKELAIEYGSGFDATNLFRMSKLQRLYPDPKTAATLSQSFSWSQLTILMAIEDATKRDFYMEMCRIENWSVRGLKKHIDSALFERSAFSKHPKKLVEQQIANLKSSDIMTPEMILKDPYNLSFLGFSALPSETTLETAILNNITAFLQELGSDFCFITRQKKMSTIDTDRYLDLLFFHRGLRRLIALELKVVPFQPEHKGQMEWYLNWLDKHERREGEERPLGIILCTDKKQTDIEYLSLENTGIHIAQYLLNLPDKTIFEKRLQTIVETTREQFETEKEIRLINTEES